LPRPSTPTTGRAARWLTGPTTSKKLQTGLLGGNYQHRAKDVLSERFLVPPFSVLNTREGWWQDRKRQWIGIGIKSELGRGWDEGKGDPKKHMMVGKDGGNLLDYYGKGKKNASPGGSPKPAMDYSKKQRGRGDGSALEDGESLDGGTSVFDPVLCELCYRWFCPPGGRVADPFAGGSVRGIIAGELGLNYWGMDLSQRQVKANREQAEAIGTKPIPLWIEGDSRKFREELGQKRVFDFIFSCPPYGSLEVYSDNPKDLSAMSDDEFAETYIEIIGETVKTLKPDRFAAFVVGDYRNKDGFYQDLPGLTTAAFEAAGMRLYNTAILLNSTGSLPLRVQNQFNGSRKLGTTHQYVLVYTNGQPREFVKQWEPWK
jgi:DNA modification methylase